MVFARRRNCITCVLAIAASVLGPADFYHNSLCAQDKAELRSTDNFQVANRAGVATDAEDPLPQNARFRIGSERFVHRGRGAKTVLSPDEKTLVSLGEGSLICWDTSTGKALWSENLGNEVDAVYGSRPIAFSIDSRSFYFQGGPGEVIHWDVAKHSTETISVKHSLPMTAKNRPASVLPGSIRSIDASLDGSRIAAGGGQGVVVCNPTGVSLFELPNSPPRAIEADDWKADPGLFGGHYSSAVFSRDGTKLAVLFSQFPQAVLMFDAVTGKELTAFQCASRIAQCEFSPGGESLTTIDRNGTLVCFAANTGDIRWRFAAGSGAEIGDTANRSTSSMQYTADGKRIVLADSYILFIDAVNGKVLFRSELLAGTARGLAIAEKANLLYVILDSGKIVRANLQTGQLIDGQLSLKAPHLLAAAAHSTKYAFVDSADAVRLSDTAAAPEPIATKDQYSIPGARILRLAMSRDGTQVAAAAELTRDASRELAVVIWNTRDGVPSTKTTLNFPALDGANRPVANKPEVSKPTSRTTEQIKLLEFSPDGALLVGAAHEGDQVLIWDIATTKLLAKVEHPSLNCLSFDRSGKQLITGGSDDRLRYWDCSTGELLNTREVQGGELQNVRCSPTSDLIVTAHFPNVLRYWKASDMTLKKRTPLSGDTNFQVLNFSSNGNWLLTTSSGYLLVIDTNSGNVVWKNAFHSSQRVIQAAFSSGDKRLMSAGRDGVAYCWELLSEEAAANAQFDQAWLSLRDGSTEDINELLWRMVQMSDAAVDSVRIELEAVTRVVSVKAISRGMSPEVAAHRASLANQLSQNDNSVEIESRVKYAVNFLVLLRSPKAIALLEQLASEHNCKEIRKEAMLGLESLK